jgi:hypothetical protein
MKRKQSTYIRILNILGIVCTIAVILCGIYIMVNQMGLIPEFDFGAGAYYYADIPGFEKLVSGDHYANQTPMSVLILLFLAWGYIMYRLWVWLDKK